MTEFQQFMEKVLAPVDLPPDPEAIADAMLDQATGNLSKWQQHLVDAFNEAVLHGKSVLIVRGPRYHGSSIAEQVLRMQHEIGALRPVRLKERLHIEPSKFLIDELAKLDREMRAEEPEPEDNTAKNGMKANRTTARAKAKLPFYHKNRRF